MTTAHIIAAASASKVPGVAYGAIIVMLRVLDPSKSCENANCTAPNYPNPTASSLNYFAGLRERSANYPVASGGHAVRHTHESSNIVG
jgi:hypothetical protein